jgi:hypothetical protein
MKKAIMVLEDGTVICGSGFGVKPLQEYKVI